jgi:hypothetical protein
MLHSLLAKLQSPGVRAATVHRWTIVFLCVLMAVAFLLGSWWRRWPVEARRRPVTVASSLYENTRAGVSYVGDAACARCHAEVARSYGKHPMGRSAAAAADVLPAIRGLVLEVGALAYSIDRRDGRVFHQETRRNAKGHVIARTEAEARYAIGSGTRGFAFLVQRDGNLYQSPLAWYSEKQGWDLAPGYRIENLHFDRPITLDCLFCHTNRVELVEGQPPRFHGLTIGCERCHGPGELHVRRPARIEGRDLSIVNPATLESLSLRDAVCEQCHLQGTDRTTVPGRSPFDYRPGLDLAEFVRVWSSRADPSQRMHAVGQVEQMRESQCYRKSDGRLGCISCHDPHRLPEAGEQVAYFRNRCLECHADRGCTLPRPVRLERNANDDCTACHMPRAPATNVPHTSRTLHNIPRVADGP